MGNCLFGGLGEPDAASSATADDISVVQVTTSHGGLMEFSAPITAGTIADQFPGHAVFRTRDFLIWEPLLCRDDELVPGKSYRLLPLDARHGHVRSNSADEPPPYRMSLDSSHGESQGGLKRSYTDVFSRFSGKKGGFWKVKLVIRTEQLAEILSEAARTEELIDSVRAVARCRNGGISQSLPPDQCSRSSSRNASSNQEIV